MLKMIGSQLFLIQHHLKKQLAAELSATQYRYIDIIDPTKDCTVMLFHVTTLNPDDIVKFRIKEEWVFDREASRMFVRILGIAPCKTHICSGWNYRKRCIAFVLDILS